MLALFFEVLPKPGHEDHYFRHAGKLKPVLDGHPGMTWLDRFRSMSRERVILSHQLWEDEAAIERWRNDRQHKASQRAGRYTHFEDYRIRIAELLVQVQRDEPVTQLASSANAADSYVVAGHSLGHPLEGFDESFASVNNKEAYVSLSSVSSQGDVHRLIEHISHDSRMKWGFAARIVRDYGMFERTQAPQDYPPVDPSDA